MAKIVIALLMITVFVLIILLLLIIGLSVALLVFSRKRDKRQGLSVKREAA
jgi:hypothetical protein